MSDQKKDETGPAGSVKKGGGGLPRRTVYLVLILVAALAIVLWRQSRVAEMSPVRVTAVTTMGKAAIGGAFTLVDQNGETVTQDDFKGRYMLIYFGYTFCPDVCPTSLSVMADAIDMIGDKAAGLVPIFVTVDPARDTPEQMKMYVAYFHPALVGLTGSEDQVAAAAAAYKVYFARAGDDGGEEYLMDHSSITYLMGPDGEFISHFSHGVGAEEMAKRLMELL